MQKPFVKVSPKKNLQFFGFTFEKNYYENTNIVVYPVTIPVAASRRPWEKAVLM